MCTKTECPRKDSTSTKVCARCGVAKPYTDFSFRIRSDDFHQPWCKFCDNNHHKLRPYLTPIKCKVAKRTYRSLDDITHAYQFVDDGNYSIWVVYCRHCTYFHTIHKELMRPNLSNYRLEHLKVINRNEPIPFLTHKSVVRKH